MNVQDTAAVIAYFGAAFPNFDPSDDTLDVWVAEVEDIDPTDAYEAMRSLVKTSRFVPSIAEFRAECKALALRRQQQPPARAISTGRGEVPEELVGALRVMAADASRKQHWHGGPEPCRVCGGMKPSKAS